MMLSTKLEVHNVSQRPQRRTDRPSKGHSQQAQKIGEVLQCSFRVMQASGRTDILSQYFAPLPGWRNYRGVTVTGVVRSIHHAFPSQNSSSCL